MFSVSNMRGVKGTLKLEEFISVMRSAMGRQGGSEPLDLTDKARSLLATSSGAVACSLDN